jgi:hypothetical protein
MRLSVSLSAHHLAARATSGRHLDIRYDPATNALTFIEAGWSVDMREPATPPSVHREALQPVGKRRPAALRRRKS